MGAKSKQKSTGKKASRRKNISHSEQEDVQGKENEVVDEEMISPENPDQDYQEKEPSEISLEAADSIPISGHSILQESLENPDKFLKMFTAHLAKGEFDLEETLPVLTKDEQLCKLCLDLEVVYESPPMGLKRVVSLQCKHLLDLQKLEHKGVEVVAKCLETWYNNKMEERDEVAKPLLRYLIGRALGKKGAKADVKRIWNLHQVLLSLRLDEGGRKDILLQCVGHPLFLTTPEGVKFNVFLFSLSVPFIQDIHKKARTVLPTLTGKQSHSLGEVYHKAWGNSGGEFLTSLEDSIQNIMECGMLVQRGNTLEPFQANNHTVRLNATELFLSAYPIEDSTQDICVKSAFLEKQHTQIIQLLKDNSVEVRVAAVIGVGRILSVYWLMFPSETLSNLVGHMVRELSVDSDYRVRVAVFQSFKSMLGESHSHVYLKEVLPHLKRSLHDVNETVRIAFVDLLLQVCNIKTIKFWDICDLSNLLARVEIDRPVVARGIVKLLLPSFFSEDLEVGQKLSRCINMIKENGPASRNFYMLLIQFSDLKSLVELMIGILSSIRSFLKSKSAQDESERNNSGVEKNKRRKVSEF
ncbi:condensin-2 complex subunit G2 [Eurytemora carolleeae]|uniref:condensin-2 complex subunit G2 n=1 Tax=Eurytemora carolleeae TaxID=1294199 RepID=UPI000C786821|nr:condensin-2 complex subunit G2 [Eurytemora carolleeae]|eukprot:XP_023329486.1 condensin-2 complex subunit G2-like [Eurytemora affinis]